MSVTQAIRNPRGYIVRTAGMYRALLFDPERFYDDYLGSRGMRIEIALVAFIGVVGLAGNYYARTRITEVFTEAGVAIGNETDFSLWGNTVEPLVGIVLLWVGFTTALFALSWLYSAVGDYYIILKNTAWTLVPLFFFNLIHTGAMAYAAFQLEEDDVNAAQVPRDPERKIEVLWGAVAGEIFVVATLVVGALIVGWAAYIALYGLVDARKLQMNDAYKVVGVTYGAFALYLVYDAATTLL